MIFCNPKDGGRSECSVTRAVLPKTLVVFAILWGGACCGLPSTLLAQTRGADRPAPSEENTPVLPGQSSATIGPSGFKVPIPEIKMNRILGGSKRPKAEQAPSQSVKPPSGERPDSLAPKSPEERPAPPGASSPPGKNRPSEENERQPEQSVKPLRTSPREPGSTRTPGPARGPREQSSQHPETREPESRPSFTVTPIQPSTEGGAQKEELDMIMSAPQAPEDVIAPPPPPRKEVLRPTAIAPPVTLKNAPVKEGAAVLEIRRTEADDLADPREWVQLDQRRLPEIESPAEVEALPHGRIDASGVDLSIPQPDRITKLRQPGPQTGTEKTGEAKPEGGRSSGAIARLDSRVSVPEETLPRSSEMETKPSPVAEPEGAKETRSIPAAIEPGSEKAPKETIAPSGGAPSAPKEVLPSPLEDGAVASPEVRTYLQQAAPILEELSVLMTTAPSLNLADYDPSDSASPAIPKDIYLRMDAIKRQLQILDSKTFAIIPPPKYAAFHSLIRESIAETYQACTAIMGYLQENNAEDLRVIRDHLLRAKKLIQRTRPRSSQG